MNHCLRFTLLILIFAMACGDQSKTDDDNLAGGIGDGEIGGSDESSSPGGARPSSDFASSGAAGTGGGMAAAPPSDFGGDGDGDSGGFGDSDGDFGGEAGGDPVSSGPGTGQVEPGMLTAGAWDDNLNFERFSDYRDSLLQETSGVLPTTDEEHAAAHDKWSGDRDANTKLDVALVIDTTGSMTDEIYYLQSEFLAISASIEEAYPNAEQRWALILYRDEGDAYVVRWFDFREDADDFREHLGDQSADGGGDFPEAPDQALEKMTELDWRTEKNTARLAFWVADAPHHDRNADRLADALRAAADIDVHVYPVASSGIDELTELTMRSSAQLTGGRYLFLTDDSGLGGAHKEPTIPCYFVTHLDDAITRMVQIELSGEYREPTKGEIVREGGDPQDGACTLESGAQVFSF